MARPWSIYYLPVESISFLGNSESKVQSDSDSINLIASSIASVHAAAESAVHTRRLQLFSLRFIHRKQSSHPDSIPRQEFEPPLGCRTSR